MSLTPEQRETLGKLAHAAYFEGCRIRSIEEEKLSLGIEGHWDVIADWDKEQFRIWGEQNLIPSATVEMPMILIPNLNEVEFRESLEKHMATLPRTGLITLPRGIQYKPNLADVSTQELRAELDNRRHIVTTLEVKYNGETVGKFCEVSKPLPEQHGEPIFSMDEQEGE